MLRFVKAVGGWPGKVVIVACEPSERGGDAAGGCREAVEGAVDGAVELVLKTVDELRSDAAYAEG